MDRELLPDWAFAQRGHGVFLIDGTGRILLLEFSEFLGRIASGNVAENDTVVAAVFTDGRRRRAGDLRLFTQVRSGAIRTEGMAREFSNGIMAEGYEAEFLLHEMETEIAPKIKLPPAPPSATTGALESRKIEPERGTTMKSDVTWMRTAMRRYGVFALPVVATGMAWYRMSPMARALTVTVATAGLASILVSPCLRSQPTQPMQNSSTLALNVPQQDDPLAGYTFTDLGSLGGEQSQPTDMNAEGKIAGASLNSAGQIRSFVWDRGKIADIGTLSGGKQSIAYSINDKGQVAGISQVGRNEAHAYLWDQGRMKDLGHLGLGFSNATAVNNQGEVTGTSWTQKEEARAYIWRGGKMREIETLPGHTESFGTGINDRGQIAGFSASDRQMSAFVWQEGKVRMLPGLQQPEALANGINQEGAVVGVGVKGSREKATVRAVIWKGDRPEDLGIAPGFDSSYGIGLNNRGDAVGMFFNMEKHTASEFMEFELIYRIVQSRGMLDRANYWNIVQYVSTKGESEDEPPHAFLYRQGKMLDLNRLAPSGWTLAIATSINDKGQIVGLGVREKKVRAFLLTPSNG